MLLSLVVNLSEVCFTRLTGLAEREKGRETGRIRTERCEGREQVRCFETAACKGTCLLQTWIALCKLQRFVVAAVFDPIFSTYVRILSLALRNFSALRLGPFHTSLSYRGPNASATQFLIK